MKDTQTQIAEHPPSGSNCDAHADGDTKLEGSAAP